ncbi:hypothetical protein QF000_007807, partial [Paraburkholderia atlantica]
SLHLAGIVPKSLGEMDQGPAARATRNQDVAMAILRNLPVKFS